MKTFYIFANLALLLNFAAFSQNTTQDPVPLTDDELKNNTWTYKATVFSSNFIIPMVRFNLIDDLEESKAKGNISLFSSIGAGLSWSMGRLEETYDNESKVTNTEFYNTFGIQLGFLFSANTGEENSNVFAPTLGLTFLNFQIGAGYELGTIADNQKRVFITLAYAIPVSKLLKGGFWVQKKSIRPIEKVKGKFFPN